MLGPIHQAVGGMHAGFDRLDRAAKALARDGAAGDPAGRIVDLQQARRDVQVGVAVVRTADEMIGSLLDVFA